MTLPGHLNPSALIFILKRAFPIPHETRKLSFNLKQALTVTHRQKNQDIPMNDEKHIITMLVDNEPGVTARVSGLFASRGYNIETICGAPTANPEMSRITITTQTNPEKFEQILKHVRRLINVIKVRDMTGEDAVKRECALICVQAAPETRSEINRIVDTFRARIVDTGLNHYILEVTGRQAKVDALIRTLEPMGIKKVARSGILALYREPE
jgi:acetolactate synthase-1/3 small subunit